jgi:hypothetical protein
VLARTLAAIAALTLLSVGSATATGLRDLHFGETLFHAYQGHYFEALERLDAEIGQHYAVDEPELDALQHHIDHAEFSVGDFELHYRMHLRAGRAIKAVLENDVEEPVRNEAAFRLARIHFQKDQPEAALHALDRIRGSIPEDIRDEIEFLRANVYLALGQASDAVDVLRRLQSSEQLAGFSAYNLGIALLQDGHAQDAVEQLDYAGRLGAGDDATWAIRDKSNLVLGTLLFESSEFGPAQSSLDRVRLDGPFSNQALLRAGWADVSARNFERALVPWNLLAERQPTDAAVQEALIALPYAYSQLDVHGRAAVLYGRAVETFSSELGSVDASIRSIRDGEFLKALVREEIRQSKDWVIRLRSLPEAPETLYLIELMASHDFQTALQNYLDLEDLRKKLVRWQSSFVAFEDLIETRRDYYAPRLPQIDHEFRQIDARIRLRKQQRNHLAKRLENMLIAPRPDLLATSAEQHAALRIEQMEDALASSEGPVAEDLRARLRHLRGVLHFGLETRYHERLTRTHENLRELTEEVERLDARYDAFVRTRQAASHSYVGYDDRIAGLRARVGEALERLGSLMARQGHLLETVAIEELGLRRDRLEAYQNQARFALADSYDRAAKAQTQAR